MLFSFIVCVHFNLYKEKEKNMILRRRRQEATQGIEKVAEYNFLNLFHSHFNTAKAGKFPLAARTNSYQIK